jgi:hypothetical protein
MNKSKPMKKIIKIMGGIGLLCGSVLMATGMSPPKNGVLLSDEQASSIQGGCCSGAYVNAVCRIWCNTIIVSPGGGCNTSKPSGNNVYCCSSSNAAWCKDNVSSCKPE